MPLPSASFPFQPRRLLSAIRSSAINRSRLRVVFSLSARSTSILGGLNLTPVDVERRLTLSSTLRRVASKGFRWKGDWLDLPLDVLFSPMKEKRWWRPSRGAASTGVSEMAPPGLAVFGRVLKLRLKKLDGKMELRGLSFFSVGWGLTGFERKWVETGWGNSMGTRESDNKCCSRSKERWT